MNICNKKSFEYDEVIKYGRVLSNPIKAEDLYDGFDHARLKKY